QGHSLVSALRGSGTGRSNVYVEEDQKEDMTGAGVDTRMRTLVTEDGRITVYQGHSHGELFAKSDTAEMSNLYNRPEARDLQQHLLNELMQAMLAHAENSPRPTHNA
ncbi:MAG TPA: hypothetical protein VJ998_03100, partial [Pseudomonadales bacterium]|nr:hypothetical protein [Pseudomonadales bacterium]